jgi:hypothetical protein
MHRLKSFADIQVDAKLPPYCIGDLRTAKIDRPFCRLNLFSDCIVPEATALV